MGKKKMTTASGRPVADNQNVQTAGQRGPMLIQDPWFLENFGRSIEKKQIKKNIILTPLIN